MKIRIGFVSNSSSSSFIVHSIGKFATINLAKKMICARKREDDKTLIRRLNQLKEKSEIENPNIYFHSCNYNTFITNVGGYIFVITNSNNPEFKEVVNDIRFYDKNHLSIELKNYFTSKESVDCYDEDTFDGDFDEFYLKRMLVDKSIYFNLESEIFENGIDLEY